MLEKLYEVSPIFVQNMMCSTYGFMEKRIRYSRDFYNYLDFLNESEYWSENEILEYKNKHVQELYQYCYDSITFYRDRFKKHGLISSSVQGIEDIVKLPVLTKEDVRIFWSDYSNKKYTGKLISRHTSGTSGKALDFYSSPNSIAFQWAVWWRHRKRFDVKLGDKHLNFIGKRVVPIKQKKPPYWRINKAFNQHLINMQHIKYENIAAIVNYINRERFVFFSGYPSIIYALADLIKTQGLRITAPPKIIFTGAEKVYDYQRILLKEVFQCEIADQYGFSEGAGNASSCEYGTYHEDFEFGHLELAQSSTELLEGEVLATGFSNYAMPLIRYKVGDSANKTSERCRCGRSSFTISSFDGRVEDYVLTPEGAKIQRFDYLFKETQNIKECQIVQRHLNEITFRIIPRKGYSANADELALKRLVREWISPGLEVYFEYPNEIERSRTGKYIAVKSFIDKP